LSWPVLSAFHPDEMSANQRQPLTVKPILTYEIPERRTQTSW